MQVQRQIDQMVMFIKQEAEEKANEISMSAEEVRCGPCLQDGAAFAACWLTELAMLMMFCRSSIWRSSTYWSLRSSAFAKSTSAKKPRWSQTRKCVPPGTHRRADAASTYEHDYWHGACSCLPSLLLAAAGRHKLGPMLQHLPPPHPPTLSNVAFTWALSTLVTLRKLI